jgi:hypothetical protein
LPHRLNATAASGWQWNITVRPPSSLTTKSGFKPEDIFQRYVGLVKQLQAAEGWQLDFFAHKRTDFAFFANTVSSSG